jgi:hypothetical protein
MSAVLARFTVLAAACAGILAASAQAIGDSVESPVTQSAPAGARDDVNEKPPVRNDLAKVLRDLGARVENPNLPPWPSVPTSTITAQVPND